MVALRNKPFCFQAPPPPLRALFAHLQHVSNQRLQETKVYSVEGGEHAM